MRDMQKAVESALRDIRTDSLQDQIADGKHLSPHQLLRMFVLALAAGHVSVISRAKGYVDFGDLARILVDAEGAPVVGLSLGYVEEVAREALARMARTTTPECPVGEWLWEAAGAAHPEYYIPAIKGMLTGEQRGDIEGGTRPWIPPCVTDRRMPPPTES